jgi:predicted transcriptional regulator
LEQQRRFHPPILEEFPSKRRPAYSTVQTTVYRLEAKGVVRRIKKIGNAHIFKATISRSEGERGFLERMLMPFLGRHEPVMSYLIETGRLTLEDVQKAERLLRNTSR